MKKAVYPNVWERGSRQRYGGLWAVIGVVASIAILSPAYAGSFQEHPHYLHALSDLRMARAFLTGYDEANVVADEKSAIREVDKAMAEIKQAAIDDGKDLRDHPPIDANIKHGDRLHHAIDLLRAAQKDLTLSEEDNQAALGWRMRAVADIDHSLRLATKAVHDDYRDDHKPMPGVHPEYLKAISDLRLARAFVAGPNEQNVMADEKETIKAIYDAIREARKAAIDDGQDLSYNPPADNNLPRHNRLQKALRLLQDAHTRLNRTQEADVSNREGLYNTVIKIDHAIAYAKKAIEDDNHNNRDE